ncbi:MAG: type II toxin-antitoxin system PemK/MazF family toxin, partial [Sphingomonas hengshuiensis]
MPIQYHPRPGTIVICDYCPGFRPPEMVKRRLAVVVSPRLSHRNYLCTVAPLSTTAPEHASSYQPKIRLPVSPPPPYTGTEKWVKGDMLFTASFGTGGRLTLPCNGRDPVTGSRRYLQIVL